MAVAEFVAWDLVVLVVFTLVMMGAMCYAKGKPERDRKKKEREYRLRWIKEVYTPELIREWQESIQFKKIAEEKKMPTAGKPIRFKKYNKIEEI
jgi:hypothetical protein